MHDKVIEVMKEGGSKVELAAELGIARSVLYEWIDKYPAFAEVVKLGDTLSQAWWEKKGKIGLTTYPFNATVWIFNMKNRFRDDWQDKIDHNTTGNVSINWPLPKTPLDD